MDSVVSPLYNWQHSRWEIANNTTRTTFDNLKKLLDNYCWHWQNRSKSKHLTDMREGWNGNGIGMAHWVLFSLFLLCSARLWLAWLDCFDCWINSSNPKRSDVDQVYCVDAGICIIYIPEVRLGQQKHEFWEYLWHCLFIPPKQ